MKTSPVFSISYRLPFLLYNRILHTWGISGTNLHIIFTLIQGWAHDNVLAKRQRDLKNAINFKVSVSQWSSHYKFRQRCRGSIDASPALLIRSSYFSYLLTFSKCFFPFHSFASLLLLLFIAVALRPSRYFF